MTAGARGLSFVTVALAGCLVAGCIYTGNQSDPLDRPGTPVGMTAVKVPLEKLIAPAPPPAGFSSTYQKRLFERQRLARQQAERDAQTKSSPPNERAKADSTNTAPPPNAG